MYTHEIESHMRCFFPLLPSSLPSQLLHPPMTHLGWQRPQPTKQNPRFLHALLGLQPPQANLPIVDFRGVHGLLGGGAAEATWGS